MTPAPPGATWWLLDSGRCPGGGPSSDRSCRWVGCSPRPRARPLSPLSSDQKRRWRHSDLRAAARREEAPGATLGITGEPGARLRPGAPRGIQGKASAASRPWEAPGRQRRVRAQQGVGTKAWRRSGQGLQGAGPPAGSGGAETRPRASSYGNLSYDTDEPLCETETESGLQNSTWGAKEEGGGGLESEVRARRYQLSHTRTGQCVAQGL